MYASIHNNVIQSVSGLLPLSARRLDTGDWILGLRAAPVDLQQACGYFQVVETTEPAPSGPNIVVESTVELVAGVPTRVWSERAMTQAEIDASTMDANSASIVVNLEQDMTLIQAIIDRTNAEINASPAPLLKDVCRMLRRLGRQALSDFDGTT